MLDELDAQVLRDWWHPWQESSHVHFVDNSSSIIRWSILSFSLLPIRAAQGAGVCPSRHWGGGRNAPWRGGSPSQDTHTVVNGVCLALNYLNWSTPRICCYYFFSNHCPTRTTSFDSFLIVWGEYFSKCCRIETPFKAQGKARPSSVQKVPVCVWMWIPFPCSVCVMDGRSCVSSK